ncbi:MAG: RNA polymerase sigma factor [Alphaproteobacteria bacterium]
MASVETKTQRLTDGDRRTDPTVPDTAPSEIIALYLERRASLVRLFAAKLGSAAAAEDLVQDIYLKLATLKLSTVVHNPMALLYQIGSNLMLDRLRQQKRGLARDTAWRDSRRISVGKEEIADIPTADDAVSSRQRLLAATATIEDLPPRMRQAFSLHRLEGLSQAATAKAMGVSTKAVEKHISAAIKILVKRLGSSGNGAV